MHKVLRNPAYERYIFAYVDALPGDVWTNIGDVRVIVPGTERPIMGGRAIEPAHFQMDPFTSYGDQAVLTLQLSDDAGYLAGVFAGGLGALDGAVITVGGAGLNGGVPVYDGPDFYWTIFGATIIDVVGVDTDVYQLTAEVIVPEGDMDKSVYDTNDDGVVNAADHAVDADQALSALAANFANAAAEATKAFGVDLKNPLDLGNKEYVGTTRLIPFANTAALGDVVYVDSNGKAGSAQANSLTTLPAVYMALEDVLLADVLAATPMLVLVKGYLRNDAWVARTVGGAAAMFYLDDAFAGAMAQVVAGPGNYIQALGYAIAPKIVAWRPDITWAEAAP